ncbi:intraflagellar transport-associated protein-like isoform X2 [Ylistrum balloti]|uniref:intraflagellar transport-associated protein-like isoform X2 n=1 Tax=Ylistrum balloti TaxID=509963 RepID=UPI002905A1ED|nr:intraflagellar transport-associated protein-like isoform X2 [Ylistrum balloti]
MSDISLSPTPSQENLANTMDASMYNAIDTFMANEEQSYDDFMKQFTHLTKDDVKAEMLRKREVMFKKMKESNSKSVAESSKQCSVPKDVSDTCPGVFTGEVEELEEEEVLEFGTSSSIMTSGVNNGPKQSVVKFDNFVEIDEDDEDLLEGSGYVASFAEQDPNLKSEEPSLLDQEQTDTKETESQREITPASLAVIEPNAEIGSAECGVLNPGEVEDLPSIEPVIQKDQTLNFSAKFMEGAPIEEDQQVCTDEVEPFCLDTDFDYDNVILTPKYSQEDVILMKTLREQNQAEKTNSQENET